MKRANIAGARCREFASKCVVRAHAIRTCGGKGFALLASLRVAILERRVVRKAIAKRNAAPVRGTGPPSGVRPAGDGGRGGNLATGA